MVMSSVYPFGPSGSETAPCSEGGGGEREDQRLAAYGDSSEYKAHFR